MICPQCQTENVSDAIVCTRCGFILAPNYGESPSTIRSPELPAATDVPPEPPLHVDDARTLQTNKLTLYINKTDNPIIVDMTTPVTLGRYSPNNRYQPEIDLTPYHGHALGVSRQHAIIQKTAAGYTIKDLASSNGTTVNGVRLQANIEYILHSGDRVGLGQLIIEVHFRAPTEQSTNADRDNHINKPVVHDTGKLSS
jgi:pSer/pThr/pTyr-binding forkhead associated (FHA) protein